MSKTRISSELASMIFVRDNGRCRACGMADPHNLAVDHVIPESLGGKTVCENLQTLCGFCNGCKGSVIVDSLPIRQPVVGFGDFTEVMQNRENFRNHVVKCRDRMVSRAVDMVRSWKNENIPAETIKKRIPSLVGNRNVQKVIFQAFRHDMETMKEMAR